jgi:hypothetical protein
LAIKQSIGIAFAVLIGAATPSFAQRSDQAVAWEHAMRDCSAEIQKIIQSVWGDFEVDSYRKCMARRGFKEYEAEVFYERTGFG